MACGPLGSNFWDALICFPSSRASANQEDLALFFEFYA